MVTCRRRRPLVGRFATAEERLSKEAQMTPRDQLRCFAMLLAVAAAGCGISTEDPSADPPANEATGTTAQALIGLGDCKLHAYEPPQPSLPNTAAMGKIDACNHDIEDLRVQVCMQQYIGGWQTMQWTCVTTRALGADVFGESATVRYLTRGRWYRSWVWGYANGATAVYTSSAVEG
jgi:hypothetical protein